MAVTVTQLIQNTLREISEATNSSLGVVGDGAGTDTVSTTTTLYDYITQAVVDWCEVAWPIPGTASLTTWAADTRTQMLHSLTLPSGQGRLHAITAVALGSPLVAMDRISLEALRGNFPSMEFDASGTSLYYYAETSFVGVYPPPGSAVAAAFRGYCVPVKAGATDGAAITSSYSFAPDDMLLRVIPPKAACLLAEKSFEDPSVFGRLDHLRTRYLGYQMEQRARLSPEILAHMKMPEIAARR